MKICLLFILLSSLAFSSDDASLANKLYPEKKTDQIFVQNFFKMLREHQRGNDPLMGAPGPAVKSFRLDQMKFAFLRNIRDGKVDLVMFNWDLGPIDGMSKDEELSSAYGKTVYSLKSIDVKSIATQGDSKDELTNFSYIQGANYVVASLLIENPGMKIPPQFSNWKPHPNFMDAGHPLRQALDKDVLLVFSPDKDLFLDQGGQDPAARAYLEKMFDLTGGFDVNMNNVLVHESFHIQEGLDHAHGRMKSRNFNEDRKKVIEELKNQRLQKLLAAYTGIVFKLGKGLEGQLVNKELLIDLKTIIAEIKSSYLETWKYLWDYEYTEGFAEYASSQSLVQAKIISLSQKIDLEIQDESNNIAYRTGALGGLYLRYQLQRMPFLNNRDHRSSVWEIILEEENVQGLSNLELALESHALPEAEFRREIEAISEYLISTVRE